MPKRTDLTGQKFGRWTVVRFHSVAKGRKLLWLCRCECGKEKAVYSWGLTRGLSTSCGCYHKEIITKHGLHNAPIRNVWLMMMQRCTNPNSTGYEYYGARGISVCDRWKILSNFVEDMGPRPEGLTLERRDNEKGYSPENCYWATNTAQARNKRLQTRNVTGYVGVAPTRSGKYKATITVMEKLIRLGTYDSVVEAAEVRREAEDKYWGKEK